MASLLSYIEKTVEIGATALEIEHKDGKELLTAMSGDIGIGIASLDDEAAKALFTDLDLLKKQKTATIAGTSFRLRFSKYYSFGDWVHRIELKKRT